MRQRGPREEEVRKEPSVSTRIRKTRKNLLPVRGGGGKENHPGFRCRERTN